MYDFVKIDVLRGYLQVVAVFFSNIVSDALDKAKAFFGNLASIFALSFAYLSSSITPRVVFIAVLIIGFVYIVLLTFVMLSLRGTHVNRQVDGHEAMTWGQRAGLSSKKVKFYSYTLLLGIFLYLPISQAAIEVLACGGLTSRYIASEHPEACTVRTVDNQPEYDCKCSKAGGDYTVSLQM